MSRKPANDSSEINQGTVEPSLKKEFNLSKLFKKEKLLREKCEAIMFLATSFKRSKVIRTAIRKFEHLILKQLTSVGRECRVRVRVKDQLYCLVLQKLCQYHGYRWKYCEPCNEFKFYYSEKSMPYPTIAELANRIKDPTCRNFKNRTCCNDHVRCDTFQRSELTSSQSETSENLESSDQCKSSSRVECHENSSSLDFGLMHPSNSPDWKVNG
ncbi:hypothetical protein RF11_11678 [Thelohanellus kitauei]|uniref:Uncharacterized protein n=1 Tax=Thelohanellus kitauei TaxID=669202 RepID=A0A0C2M5J6_THEKT|nr:hypothetical protein RF11_11678 [Thelohanellus kitauei]